MPLWCSAWLLAGCAGRRMPPAAPGFGWTATWRSRMLDGVAQGRSAGWGRSVERPASPGALEVVPGQKIRGKPPHVRGEVSWVRSISRRG